MSVPADGTPPPAPAAPPAAPAATPPPAPAPPAAPAAGVTLTADAYNALIAAQNQLAKVQADLKADADAKEAERIKALAEKGEIQAALTALKASRDREIATEKAEREKLVADWLADRKASTVTGAIAEAMAGRTFLSRTQRSRLGRCSTPNAEKESGMLCRKPRDREASGRA